jgi:deoxyribodipyrimidine photo-lyase
MWFRRDLRLDDSPAVASAAAGGDRVVPLFVIDPRVLGPVGPNRRRFLAQALRDLDDQVGGRLVVRSGDPARVVPALATELRASLVVATADYGPYGRQRDRAVSDALTAGGCSFLAVSSAYLVPPGSVRSRAGTPFRVFTAFRRRWEEMPMPGPTQVPPALFAGADSTASIDEIEHGVAVPGNVGLPSWWAGLPLGLAPLLPPGGTAAAMARLDSFVTSALAGYARGRDRPGDDGTSRLSPYLHFGCTHPRTVVERLGTAHGADRFRTELAWRDFYADVLWHRPASAYQSLQPFGAHLRWDTDDEGRGRFRAWAEGRTGFPLVDAAMRQLLTEGWVHNRARMVAASFLIKDLHIDWRIGARWYLWHLVDGDLASNQHGWQWVAGTGTDAAPFHRIFNPGTQMERFDRDGSYVRRFLGGVPEPGKPCKPGAFPMAPSGAGPIVDHAQERQDALARFDEARRLATARDGSKRRPQ